MGLGRVVFLIEIRRDHPSTRPRVKGGSSVVMNKTTRPEMHDTAEGTAGSSRPRYVTVVHHGVVNGGDASV